MTCSRGVYPDERTVEICGRETTDGMCDVHTAEVTAIAAEKEAARRARWRATPEQIQAWTTEREFLIELRDGAGQTDSAERLRTWVTQMAELIRLRDFAESNDPSAAGLLDRAFTEHYALMDTGLREYAGLNLKVKRIELNLARAECAR